MKNTSICPKCRSTNIICVPGPAKVGHSANKVPTGWFTSGNVDRFVCHGCGFTEEWIPWSKDLDKLAEKFGHLDGGSDYV